MPSKTERTTISIRENTFRRATALMERLDIDFSGLVQKLITDEYERRHGPLIFEEATEPTKNKATALLKKAVRKS